MINILIHTPNIRDATSFYRAWGPWTHLKDEFNIEFVDSKDLDWYDLATFDILFVHRPYSQTHLSMIQTAKKMGLPVWIDFDDDLFNLHHSNKNFHLYDNASVKLTIKRILLEASLITVSTEHLKKIYSEFSICKIEVIHNKLPEHILGNALFKTIDTLPRKIVLWRGTEHHDVNLQYYRNSFYNLMRNNQDWLFVFFGFKPWYLMEMGNPGQSMHMAEGKIVDYLLRIQDLQAAIQVIPLVDNVFNRSKSAISYLEGAGFAGSVCVQPDSQEWNDKQGSVVYAPSNVESFTEAVQRTIDMKTKQRMTFSRLARKYVQEKHTLESVKELRISLAKELVS